MTLDCVYRLSGNRGMHILLLAALVAPDASHPNTSRQRFSSIVS